MFIQRFVFLFNSDCFPAHKLKNRMFGLRVTLRSTTAVVRSDCVAQLHWTCATCESCRNMTDCKV